MCEQFLWSISQKGPLIDIKTDEIVEFGEITWLNSIQIKINLIFDPNVFRKKFLTLLSLESLYRTYKTLKKRSSPWEQFVHSLLKRFYLHEWYIFVCDRYYIPIKQWTGCGYIWQENSNNWVIENRKLYLRDTNNKNYMKQIPNIKTASLPCHFYENNNFSFIYNVNIKLMALPCF